MEYNRKLVLADGSVFNGNGFGLDAEVVAEVVFYTGMAGYEHVLTDGAFHSQAVVMSYPLIGNYGVDQSVMNAAPSGTSAMIVKEHCTTPSNWKSVATIDEALKAKGIVGLCDVDTRALVIKLREVGTMRGIIVDAEVSVDEALGKLEAAAVVTNQVETVETMESYRVAVKNSKHKVAVLSFGAKIDGIVDELTDRDCEVVVLPFTQVTTEKIGNLQPDGVIIGNGPGSPTDVAGLTVVKEIVDQYPTFGIGLGMQLIALSAKATISKMTFGHRGENVPVKDLATNRTLITSQNHGYVVDESSLAGANLAMTHVAINDGSVAGIKHEKLPVFGVQFQPSVHVGPADAQYLFDQFVASLGGK